MVLCILTLNPVFNLILFAVCCWLSHLAYILHVWPSHLPLMLDPPLGPLCLRSSCSHVTSGFSLPYIFSFGLVSGSPDLSKAACKLEQVESKEQEREGISNAY